MLSARRAGPHVHELVARDEHGHLGPPAHPDAGPCPPRASTARPAGSRVWPRASTTSPRRTSEPRARCARPSPRAPGSRRAARPSTARVFSTCCTAVAPAGTGAPVMIWIALPGLEGTVGQLAGPHLSHHVEHDGSARGVPRAHRVAVHGRAVEGRHVHVGGDVLRQHAAERLRRARTSSAARVGVWARTISRASSTGIADVVTPPFYRSAMRYDPSTGGGCLVPTVKWDDDAVVMIDQRRLPDEEVYLRCRDHREVAEAIRDMAIRGAPAIGVAAAFGLALGVRCSAAEGNALRAEFDAMCERPRGHAPHRREPLLGHRADAPPLRGEGGRGFACATTSCARPSPSRTRTSRACRRMGDLGADLLPGDARVLTHCNAGALATAGYGTALGVIRSAARQGKIRQVIADETRPYLQGARLTAWELLRGRHPHDAHRRQHGRLHDGAGRGERGGGGGGPHRRATATSPTRSAPTPWPSSPARTGSRSTWPPPCPPSTSPPRTAPRSRSRSARPTRSRTTAGSASPPSGCPCATPRST